MKEPRQTPAPDAPGIGLRGRLSNRWFVVLLFLLIGAGAVLRFMHLGGPGLWIDEGFSVVHARGILAHGVPELPNGEVSWTYFPAHYLMAAGLALFGDLEFGARFFTALAGSLLVGAFYAMNRRVFGRRDQALLAAALLAFLTYEIAWSRQARGYVHLQLFTVLAVGAWYRFLDTRGIGALAAALAAAAAAAATHKAGLVAPLILGFASLGALRDHRSWREWFRAHAAAALVCGALFAATLVGALVLYGSVDPSEALRVGASTPRNYASGYGAFVLDHLGRPLALLAAVGAVVTAVRAPRAVLPMLAGGALYFGYIATQSILFHFRYLLPILWIPLALAGCGAAALIDLARRAPPVLRPAALAAAVIAVGWAASAARLTLRPQADYYLGITAPKPDWQGAYARVRARYAEAPSPEGPATLTTFPMFHDLYLGDLGGAKGFLPFSISGFPGEYRETPRYSEARVVDSLAEFRAFRGFVIVDVLGLRMLKNEEIQQFLMRTPPDEIVQRPGLFDVFLWDFTEGNSLKRAGAGGVPLSESPQPGGRGSP